MSPFYEENTLNIDFQVPQKAISFTRKPVEQVAEIYLFGGKNSLFIYKYEEKEKKLVKFKEMNGQHSRHSFGTCYLSDSFMAIVGGYMDNELTATCELFYFNTRKFKRYEANKLGSAI